jgi:hypothetical protein
LAMLRGSSHLNRHDFGIVLAQHAQGDIDPRDQLITCLVAFPWAVTPSSSSALIPALSQDSQGL